MYKYKIGQKLTMKSGDVIEILGTCNGQLRIRFLSDGWETLVWYGSIGKGVCRNMSHVKYYKVGDIVGTNNNGYYEVIGEVIKDKKYTIKFIETGYTRDVAVSNMRVGTVKDPYTPIVAGIGCVGEGGMSEHSYRVWAGMVKRCYDESNTSFHVYGGKGVTVCKDWHNYQNFKKWFDSEYIEDYDLDKDLKNPNSREYSPDNCLFIPRALNVNISKYTKPYYVIRKGVLNLTMCKHNRIYAKFDNYEDLLEFWLSEIEVRMLNNCGDDVERLKPCINNWVKWRGDLLRSGSI